MKRFLFLLSLLSLILAGCKPPMTQDPVYDFILRLPEAARNHDLFVLDMSNPEHLKYLLTGWHIPDSKDMPTTRFIWSSDTESNVLLNVRDIVEKEIILTVQPYRFEGAPPILLTLEIDGNPIGKIHLKEEWRTYRLSVPSEMLRKGANRLTIRQNQVFRPSDVMVHSDDHRTLGSCYSYIVFRDAQPAKPPGLYTVQQILGAQNFVWGGRPRHVIADRSPSSFSWPVKLPSRPLLTFAPGFLPEEFDPKGADINFRIELKDEFGKEHVLFQNKIPPPQRQLEMGWKEYSRDLKSFAGQNVIITLTASSETKSDKPANDGSWLEPMILNRHVNYNLIFLPLAGYFDSESIPAGSGLEKCLFKAHRTKTISPPIPSKDSIAGVPVGYVSELVQEGFLAGYFYTGHNPFEIEAITRWDFDYATGFDTLDTDTYHSILSDSEAWIKALDKQRFFLCLDPDGWTPNSGVANDDLMLFVDWLMKYHFETDSLIVIYNTKSASPVWVLDPGNKMKSVSEIESWESLLAYIKTRFLVMDL